MFATCKKFQITFAAIFLAIFMSVLLFIDNVGIQYTVAEYQLTDLPQAAVMEKKKYEEVPKDCLLLLDRVQENNHIFRKHLSEVLEDMRVGYQIVDVSDEPVPDFYGYKTVVIGFQDLDRIAEHAVALSQWVQDGGNCMLFVTPSPTPVFRYLAPFMGVDEGGVAYSYISGLNIVNDFMLGGKDFNFNWNEPMATALSLHLKNSAEIFVESDDYSRTALLWRAASGKGHWVVNNHGLAEKATRGLTAAAYSLLDETCIYPVINASTFFLDDFPSPVPMGDGTYIRRDYNRDISSFYSNVWWPDMLKLSDNFGIKYSGVIIEDYTDATDGVFPRQTDTERFTYFGAMLLDHGGEIGLHGYNHQPLCFPGFDFNNEVDYNTWASPAVAEKALREVMDYTKTLFPDNQVSVYVPPSNILSAAGRTLLREKVPEIKVLASLYLEGRIEYSQEFEISDDGLIEFPRVISGAILDEFTRWDALNTLNLYYVNSHFMHPDDVLDVDRGAADGWEKLYGNLTNYCQWLYRSAPNIRNLRGTDAGRATARYDCLSFERTDTENTIHLRLRGFWDEAYLMVRCNGRIPAKVSGGSIEHIDGDFYLLRATQEQVEIELG